MFSQKNNKTLKKKYFETEKPAKYIFFCISLNEFY